MKYGRLVVIVLYVVFKLRVKCARSFVVAVRTCTPQLVAQSLAFTLHQCFVGSSHNTKHAM
eukprot:m.364232 g.364232  ORF g.364232 m.364232 type:complete len:61 (-) comp26066_c0_seq1:90-272(-)